jgi:hypothetical protein
VVEFPPYVRLVVDNVPRRGSQGVKAVQKRPDSEIPETDQEGDKPSPVSNGSAPQDIVQLVGRENRRASESHVPSPHEAEVALKQLQQELPGMGPAVGDLHSKLDRRVILSLLAPLISS